MAVGSVLNIAGRSGEKLVVSSIDSEQSSVREGSIVDLSCDVEMFISQGENPTAIVDESYRLLPGATYRLSVSVGERFAAITATGPGNLWIHAVG